MLRDCKTPTLIVFIVLGGGFRIWALGIGWMMTMLMVDGLVIQGGVGGGNGGHDRGPDDRKMA